jgi:hypothetical protein
MTIKLILETTNSIKFLLSRLMAEDYKHLEDLTVEALCSYKEVFRFTQFFKGTPAICY